MHGFGVGGRNAKTPPTIRRGSLGVSDQPRPWWVEASRPDALVRHYSLLAVVLVAFGQYVPDQGNGNRHPTRPVHLARHRRSQVLVVMPGTATARPATVGFAIRFAPPATVTPVYRVVHVSYPFNSRVLDGVLGCGFGRIGGRRTRATTQWSYSASACLADVGNGLGPSW